MPGPLASRLTLLRRLPAARLLAAAELLSLAREHYQKLGPEERKRVLALLRRARGRPSNLTARERRELTLLVAKADPRAFMGNAVHKLTGVPIPTGKKRSGRRGG